MNAKRLRSSKSSTIWQDAEDGMRTKDVRYARDESSIRFEHVVQADFGRTAVTKLR